MIDAVGKLGVADDASFRDALDGFARRFDELAPSLLGLDDGNGSEDTIVRWVTLCAALEEMAQKEPGSTDC